MKLHFSIDWLRRQIETDPDVETDAGRAIRSSSDIMGLIGEAPAADAAGDVKQENTLALLVHQTRRGEKLTIEQFADLIRVTPDEIEAIESDPDYSPQPRTIHNLAKFVKVPPRSLLVLLPDVESDNEQLNEAKHKFAASSDDLSQLSKSERRGLNDFVKFLANFKNGSGANDS